MKTITKLFLVGLIALGMTACSNEDEVKFEEKAESTVSIRVVPSSNGPTVRAPGDLSEALPAESAIKKLEVYLFAGESPSGYGEETGDNVTEVKEIATSVGPKTIYVVANASIGPVANKATLIAKTKALPAVIANGLPMTGESGEVELVSGLNQFGYAEVAEVNNLSTTALPLTRVNARVAIVGATLAANITDGDVEFFNGLSDVQVAMFNVPKTTKLFGTPLAMNADFLFGEAWPSSLNSYTIGTPVVDFTEGAFLEKTITFPIKNILAPYFYVNENTSTDTTKQMMIVLRAKPMKGTVAVKAEGLYTDVDGFTYYAVWVNAARDGYSYGEDVVIGESGLGDSVIRRNTQYNISLTINKIGNPSIDPPVSATVDVKVSVEPWLVVNQTVVW